MRVSEWSDERLTAECVASSRHAWNELVDRFDGVIYGVIQAQLGRWGFGGRKDLSDDIFQNIFRELFERNILAGLRRPASLKAFLVSLTISRTIDGIRAAVRDQELFEKFRQSSPWEDHDDSLDKFPAPDLRDSMMFRDMCGVIEEEMKRMPIREELIARLRWQHEMKLESIANLLEIPANTVSTILRRTRERLKWVFKEKGIEGL